MLDDKIKIEDYFMEEIKRVSQLEIDALDEQIKKAHEESFTQMQKELASEAAYERESRMKELESEQSIELSKLQEKLHHDLLAQRSAIAEEVFAAVRSKLIDFTQSKEYETYLLDKVKKAAALGYGEACLYVGKKDFKRLSALCEAFGKCEGKIDEDIVLGGLHVEYEAQGIVLDESFDTSLEEQKEWFYANAGLYVK